MANRRVLIFREGDGGNLHDFVRPGDTMVDDAGNELFVLGITPRLNLPEFDNVTPADGDVWKQDGKLRTFLQGVLFEICITPGTPPPPASSLSSSSGSAPSSSVVLSSSMLSSSSLSVLSSSSSGAP